MKKIVSFVLLMCMVVTLAACGKVDITMQEIYDAAKVEALLKNHAGVHIRNEIDGELWRETYLTKDYAYDYIPGGDEESDWAEFVTDDVYYCYMGGGYLRYLHITPSGVGDFASYRAERYASVVLGAESVENTIESVSKKDGRITVKSVLSQAALDELDVASVIEEYILDAKSREIISVISEYTYDDGTGFGAVTKVAYDAAVPEMVNTFLEYTNRTEDLRNITVVSNPGTDNEKTERIQTPKGLLVGFRYDEDSTYDFALYVDAACTEAYDPYADTDSDLTIYVKWEE